MTTIDQVDAWEVLDSRGDPTVRVRIDVGPSAGRFTVPAGASKGRHEAVERRDGDDRYGGKGVTAAITTIRETLEPLLVGRDVTRQRELDALLVETNGTEDLSHLGANAILGVSGAIARAASAALEQPLYEYLAPESPGRLPLPMVNILSGGLHATGGIEVQDFLVIPNGANSYSNALEIAGAVRRRVRERIVASGHPPLVADEGGFAPPLADIDEAFDLLLAAVEDGGFVAGIDVMLAVDFAASHFFEDGGYRLESMDTTLDSDGMVDLVVELVDTYPIISVEDPLAEDDWEGWSQLVDRIGTSVQVIADDLVATNASRLSTAIESGSANAVLIKPNQAGTITRARDVTGRARERGWGRVVSARSGETCDSTIADLAVAWDAGQIKIGSLARSERLSKYNRLLEIARRHDGALATPSSLAPRS